jgi:polyhydroxybutyrate depolymerase
MIRLLSFFILLPLLGISGCKKKDNAGPVPVVIPYPEGMSTNYLAVNGINRKYLVYRPAGLTQVRSVVTVLHGGGGAGLTVADPGTHPLSVFRNVADTAKFLLVYPEGSLDNQGNPGWNDCRRDDIAGSQGEDLPFLKLLMDSLRIKLQLTPSNMFLTGTSNGALMTYTYAFWYPSTVRAIAVSSGNLPLNPESGTCTSGSSVPLPILITHGTLDPAMPAAGGCVANLGGACNRGQVISQSATIQYWLQRNGLSNTTPTISSFDFNLSDAGNAEKRIYSGPNQIVYYVLNGAGHAVPSRTVFSNTTPASGAQNRDIEYAVEVWQFFRQYQP